MPIMKQTLWKNNLSFIKDVITMHFNFITLVTTVSGGEEKSVGGGAYFHTTLHTVYMTLRNCVWMGSGNKSET